MNPKSEQPGAVIIGGSFYSLGAARNLTKNGVPVCVPNSGICVSQFSRYVKHFLKYPPLDDDACFVDFLLRIATEKGMDSWVLFPSTDEFVRLVAQYRERLIEHYRVTIPSWQIVQLLYSIPLQELSRPRRLLNRQDAKNAKKKIGKPLRPLRLCGESWLWLGAML